MARKPAAAAAPTLTRRPVLAGRHAAGPSVSIAPAAPASRLSLRAPAESSAALAKALGLKLPERPKTSASSMTSHSSGPSQSAWRAPAEAEAYLVALCAPVKAVHSAVDISHRNTAILVTGPGAEAVLAAGCPQDLSLPAFLVGACSRTLLGKVEIVLFRTGAEAFRVEVWRSFSDYAFTFLSEAARDPAL
jgi:sarcosine oxidase, subunit gamma